MPKTKLDLPRLGTLHVVGPGSLHKQSCLSGKRLCFATATNSFGLSMVTSLFQVTPATTCADVEADTPQSWAENFRFQWNSHFSGAYLDATLTGRKWMAGRDPGIYRLCWCQNDTEGACESLSDFNVSAGLMTWHGPFKREVPEVATIGEVFKLELSGVGISSNSVLSIQHDCGTEGPSLSAKATQSSTKFLYNFGQVAEDKLPPGRYRACWCEPVPNSPCSLAVDQITPVAEVFVRCPPGLYSPNGTGACQQCDYFWDEPNQARDDCNTRAANAGQIVGLCLCYLIGWVLLWYQMSFSIEPGCRRLSISGRKARFCRFFQESLSLKTESRASPPPARCTLQISPPRPRRTETGRQLGCLGSLGVGMLRVFASVFSEPWGREENFRGGAWGAETSLSKGSPPAPRNPERPSSRPSSRITSRPALARFPSTSTRQAARDFRTKESQGEVGIEGRSPEQICVRPLPARPEAGARELPLPGEARGTESPPAPRRTLDRNTLGRMGVGWRGMGLWA